MTDRQKALQKVQIHDFMLFELALYLDTHKTDREALRFYQAHKDEARKLMEEYVAKYGPLVISQSEGTESWQWSDGPWPWEYAAN